MNRPLSSAVTWEVYEQHVYNDDEKPGPGWEPFAAVGNIEHNGLRESLGGGYESRHIIFWRRLEGAT